ncbi:MAG: hypothetical protein MK538_19465, partial [Planctomycetes bacterium]|nr:hypothetical protein [Planctomycetota bacterium]
HFATPREIHSSGHTNPLHELISSALIARTEQTGRNQRDADLCIFRHIRNFRALEVDFRPGLS